MRIFIITLIVSVVSKIALCADSNKIKLGLLGGLSFPSLSSPALSYGVKASYRVFPTFLAGLFHYSYGSGFETSSGTSSVTASTSYTSFGLEGMIDYTGGFSAGMKLGTLTVTPNVTATDSVTTIQFGPSTGYLFIGPTVNYDVPLGQFSVGGEVSYFYTMSSSAPKVLNILGTGKISF